jgi:uncharacterized membrane protein
MMQDRHLQKMLFTMRLIFIFIFASNLTVFASESYSQVTRISLNLQNVTVKDALKDIDENYSPVYDYDVAIKHFNTQVVVFKTNKDEYWPIPQQECDANSNLKQNPGY